MKLTTNVLVVFTTIMGFSKFFPQIQIAYTEKIKSSLPLPFLACEIGYFLLFGIFTITNAQNTFILIIGLINIIMGTISPSILVGQKIFYTKLEK